jgi:hypothetical protein
METKGEAKTESKRLFEFVLAIDFGTTTSGVAHHPFLHGKSVEEILAAEPAWVYQDELIKVTSWLRTELVQTS